jgi:hypothetical protein
MGIVAKVGAVLQQLFGENAEKAGAETGVIQRKRKFTAISLAKTFVLGFLLNPKASDEDLAQMAAQCGVDVTPQAVEQRHTSRMVEFLESLFRAATKLVLGSDRSLAPILERFSRVDILDSSTITLPDSMREQFAGCGGSYGFGAAAMKLQTELDLRSGALDHIEIEPGRSTDGATSRQHVRRGEGSLRITDLGYFNVGVFAEMDAEGEYFLSRLQFGTQVREENGDVVDLLPWLERHTGPFVNERIWLGKERRLPCRLIAWRVPPEQANRRRQKLRKELLDKCGKAPTAERLAWCDWTILVTNVPEDMLTPQEAVVLNRARWQVELLFKRWKSQGLVAELSGSTDVRQMVRVWSRLIAALVQHWLVVATAWGDPTKSLWKVCQAIRPFVGRIAAGLLQIDDLTGALEDLCRAIAKTCQRNKRTKPGTFEMLNDIDLLDFSLT